ncbi:fibroblast growth factor receptor homolog 1-like isoform X2 [Silurus meridionalis]|uniref:Protein kinase domain-containing protein n=2 Tax=Silurus meridionalis TaxID=175797 RepID=A0A8T0B991_SILME|nr:fibroblast growth factor receptor homolog 1-like isoform X2 [Silurus meridionalis]KAF7701306.1 hypothetical protein HF521_002471 [Silurus meridionalis]
MESNYSTPTPVFTTPAHTSTTKAFLRCEESYDETLLLYLIIAVCVSMLLIIMMALTWLKRFQMLRRSIRRLQQAAETAALTQSSGPEQVITVEPNHVSASEFNMQSMKSANSSFNTADLTMRQLIKDGREGELYNAKMARGAIKGHTMFTCKIYKKVTKPEQVRNEIMIMQNLSTHRNLLQLVDWNITDVPYMLIMEHVEHGSLRSFLKANKEKLRRENELQHLFTIALYHIAQALDHLHSKMILHCNLALRNILVHRFPHEIKVAEFGMAREIAKDRGLSRNCKTKVNKRIPCRWYPPEYFKYDFYGFEGDVWAFGIIIWEMQTFGTVPYPNLKTSEEVVSHVCAGHRTQEPAGCRPEMLEMMRDCWQEPYLMRPSFMAIVKSLENILENDRDYVNMDSSPVIVQVESKDGDKLS